ncbi:MAG: t-SNARE [Olpidium bornovanus]|uniref:t-SNARE n=1 Tax=Olpidium bornovanus TaxID=278681 RepID=A0A8H8DL65_9FUNG|nr:MAG: t-SNARE [Olpidium bornovanus]
MAALKNRTSEFHAAVESIRDRAGASSALRPSFSSERQMLVAGGGGGPGGGPNRKSHFARMAGAIGMEINKVATKLERLAKRGSGGADVVDSGTENRARTGGGGGVVGVVAPFPANPNQLPSRSRCSTTDRWRSAPCDGRLAVETWQELTFVIKQDIAKLNKQIMSLQQYVKEQKGKSKSRHFEEHTSNVVVSLQSKLASTSMSFKDVLELRTQNMKAQKDRREQFMHTSQPGGAGGALSVTTGSPLYSIDREDTERSAGEVSINLGFDSQQLQMTDRQVRARQRGGVRHPSTPDGELPVASSTEAGRSGGRSDAGVTIASCSSSPSARFPQDSYIESRSNAVATVEQTMAELGSIFQQLATMVAEQRETIQRIDANTLDIQSNVEAGGRELRYEKDQAQLPCCLSRRGAAPKVTFFYFASQYMQHVMSNRWLMAKIFGIIIFFVLLWYASTKRGRFALVCSGRVFVNGPAIFAF